MRKLKLPPSTVCLLHVLRLTIKRCHLRCIIVNICLNDGGRAEVVERNKNRLSFYLPSCEFSVSVKKKKKNRKKTKKLNKEREKQQNVSGYNVLNGLRNPRLLHLKLLMVCPAVLLRGKNSHAKSRKLFTQFHSKFHHRCLTVS